MTWQDQGKPCRRSAISTPAAAAHKPLTVYPHTLSVESHGHGNTPSSLRLCSTPPRRQVNEPPCDGWLAGQGAGSCDAICGFSCQEVMCSGTPKPILRARAIVASATMLIFIRILRPDRVEAAHWLQVYAGSVRVGFKVSKQASGCCRLRMFRELICCGCLQRFELTAA